MFNRVYAYEVGGVPVLLCLYSLLYCCFPANSTVDLSQSLGESEHECRRISVTRLCPGYGGGLV